MAGCELLDGLKRNAGLGTAGISGIDLLHAFTDLEPFSIGRSLPRAVPLPYVALTRMLTTGVNG